MKCLIIQTAFIGDVVLATPLVEKLNTFCPEMELHFLLRKGNEGLLDGHPLIDRLLIFDKKQHKFKNLLRLLQEIRQEKYDLIINVQRFAATGFLTAFSGAKERIGFRKNPFSFLFTKAFLHQISAEDQHQHEVKRNLQLITHLTDDSFVRPKLYPTAKDRSAFSPEKPYFCIAPASVWFTKQLPAPKWIELIRQLPADHHIYLLGAKGDQTLCEHIQAAVPDKEVEILAGTLNLLASTALMQGARMNFVNDSAPLHFASAVNAPVRAVFCSTVPAFGFGPLSDDSAVIESPHQLACRPCGLHGKKACPEGHFRCADVEVANMVEGLNR
ncbi:MAG: glycosyltransferase family 9 protein [Bacteroidota bacterium]